MKFSLFFLLMYLINLTFSQKIPNALSIEINRTEYYHEVFEFLQDNLFHILTEYPTNSRIKSDFDELFETEMKTLREPKSWHITLLTIDDKSKLETEIFKNFVENQEIEIIVSTLVYIPNRLMVAPVFINYPKIENKIPHVSLMLGGKFRPIDGNYILKSLFIENKELKGLYDEGFIKDPSFQINLEQNHVKIVYEDKNKMELLEHVYLIKYDSHLKFKGVTRKIYE